MTIYDISKKAGVSIATVSRVINGSENVRPKTRKKVLDIIEECGYTPNAFARGLGLNSMNNVGILCADCSDLFLAKAVFYTERELRANGYHTILGCTGYELESMKNSLSMILEQRVDAVVMIGSSFVQKNPEENEYIRAAAEQVPIMLLNADLDCPNVYCTMCDDFKSMTEVTNSLLDGGVRDILYFYNSNSYSGQHKLAGYQTSLTMRDIPVRKELIQFFGGNHDDIDEAAKLLDNLRKSGVKFDAVVASDDNLATAALKFCRQNKIKVPSEFQIIGYNNSILSRSCEPELTSVDNKLETLCSQLVKTCMAKIGGEDMPQKTIFSGEIIRRGTTK